MLGYKLFNLTILQMELKMEDREIWCFKKVKNNIRQILKIINWWNAWLRYSKENYWVSLWTNRVIKDILKIQKEIINHKLLLKNTWVKSKEMLKIKNLNKIILLAHWINVKDLKKICEFKERTKQWPWECFNDLDVYQSLNWKENIVRNKIIKKLLLSLNQISIWR